VCLLLALLWWASTYRCVEHRGVRTDVILFPGAVCVHIRGPDIPQDRALVRPGWHVGEYGNPQSRRTRWNIIWEPSPVYAIYQVPIWFPLGGILVISVVLMAIAVAIRNRSTAVADSGGSAEPVDTDPDQA
jgi:hypothetical protein